MAGINKITIARRKIQDKIAESSPACPRPWDDTTEYYVDGLQDSLKIIDEVMKDMAPVELPIRCKECGHYEKCTNLCTKHYNEKVFRQPNWFCADAVKIE